MGKKRTKKKTSKTKLRSRKSFKNLNDLLNEERQYEEEKQFKNILKEKFPKI